MNKKILIGSIVAVAILLLMPSIPAIQKNVTDEEIKQDLRDRLEEIDFKKIKSLDDDIKFPCLFHLLKFCLIFRSCRIFLFLFIGYYLDIPIAFYRGAWLASTTDCFYELLEIVSDIFNLGWDFFNW